MGTTGKGVWVVSALAYKEVEGCEGAVEDAPVKGPYLVLVIE
jgi:hypothetical protein